MANRCPNKSFRTDSNQEKSDWDILVDGIGEKMAMAIFMVNNELPDINTIKNIVDKNTPALSPKTNLIEEKSEADRIVEELSNNINNSKLVKFVENYFNTAQKQLNRLIKNKNSSKLAELFTNDQNVDEFKSFVNTLRRANKASEEIEGIKIRLRALAETIVGSNTILGKIETNLRDLTQIENPSPEEIITIQNSLKLAVEWERELKEAKKAFEYGNPDFRSKINNSLGIISTIKEMVLEEGKSNLSKNLLPILRRAGETYIKLADEELTIQSKLLKQSTAKDDRTKIKDIQNRIKEWEDRKKKFDFSIEQNLLSLMTGVDEHGNPIPDTNGFSVWLESFRDNPDPLVSSFALYISNVMDDATYEAAPNLIKFYRNTAPLIKKLGGFLGGFNSVKMIGDKLTYIEDTGDLDENGNPVYEKRFLNPFQEIEKARKEYQNTVTITQQELKLETDDKKKRELRKKLHIQRRDLEQHLNDYWHRPYFPEFYEKKFKEYDDIGVALQEDMDDLMDEVHDTDIKIANADLELVNNLKLIRKKLLSDYSKLSKTTDEFGKEYPKDSEEYKKAIRAKEIKKNNRELYDWKINIPKYERDRESFKKLLVIRYGEDSEEYTTKLQEWDKSNTTVKYKDEWYKKRKEAFDVLKSASQLLKSKLSKEEIDKFKDFSEIWEYITDITLGERDQFNQIIGINLTAGQIESIKSSEEQLEILKKNLVKSSGLSTNEWNRFNELTLKSIRTDEENEELQELKDKKTQLATSKSLQDEIDEAIATLQEIQKRVATDYYIDELNGISKQYQKEFAIIPDLATIDADEILNPSSPILQELLKHPDFKEWFNKNHYKTSAWDKETKEYQDKWARLYNWNQIIPTDEKYIETTTLEDGTILQGVPSSYYSYRQVKDKFISPEILHKTVGIDGKYLPKLTEDGAKNDKYYNKKYWDLQKRTDEEAKNIKDLLNLALDMHFKSQENISIPYKRLGYRVPSQRKHFSERLGRNLPKNIIKSIKSKFASEIEFSNGEGNYVDDSPEEKTRNIINTTTEKLLFYGFEENQIPVKFTEKIPVEDISDDVLGGVSRYYYSSVMNKNMIEKTLPLANALINIIKETGQENTNRATALEYMIQKLILGKGRSMTLGKTGEKIASSTLSGLAHTHLTLNFPSTIANLIAGLNQNFIENGNGYFSRSDFANAEKTIAEKLFPSLLKDLKDYTVNRGRVYFDLLETALKNKTGVESPLTQLFFRMEPIQGETFESRAGEVFSRTHLKSLLGFRFITQAREFTEVMVQAQIWVAHMEATQVKQTIDGKTKIISLLEAYENDENGIIKLKEGVDKKWDFGGENFQDLKNRIQQSNRRTQGTFATMDKGMAYKWTFFRMLTFLQNWIISPAINRFASNIQSIKTNWYKLLGGFTIGATAFSIIHPYAAIISYPIALRLSWFFMAKGYTLPRFNIVTGYQWGWYSSAVNATTKYLENGVKSWNLLNNEEKIALGKHARELALFFSIQFLLWSMVGIGDDDKKAKEALAKLRKEHPMLYYQLVARASQEVQTFEDPTSYLSAITSLAVISDIMKFINVIRYAIPEFTDSGFQMKKYEKKSGTIPKGTWKLKVALLRAFGLQYAKNTFNEEDLQDFVKKYDLQTRAK